MSDNNEKIVNEYIEDAIKKAVEAKDIADLATTFIVLGVAIQMDVVYGKLEDDEGVYLHGVCRGVFDMRKKMLDEKGE